MSILFWALTLSLEWALKFHICSFLGRPAGTVKGALTQGREAGAMGVGGTGEEVHWSTATDKLGLGEA